MTTLGIGELADVCREMERRSTDLFELLGSWVVDEPDPVTQRLFAEACHRHAWHADLWRARTPQIPVVPAGEHAASSSPTDEHRAGWYRSELDALRSELDELRQRTDPDLDPSTRRTIALVAADLTDLDTRTRAIS